MPPPPKELVSVRYIVDVITSGIQAEVRRLRLAGLKFRNDILTGPGSAWVAFDDRAGNPVGLFRLTAPNHAS
jgi:hypothetical protein